MGAPTSDSDTAGPAEVEARLRLAIGRRALRAAATCQMIRSSATSRSTRPTRTRRGCAAADLTFKEFELLKFRAAPWPVFTGAHLLRSQVWGYDYFGGTLYGGRARAPVRVKLLEHEARHRHGRTARQDRVRAGQGRS